MISEQNYRKFSLIFLGIIAVVLVIFLIGAIVAMVQVNTTVNNIKNDIANVADRSESAVASFIQEIKETLPSLF